jgi:hypothetical protein
MSEDKDKDKEEDIEIWCLTHSHWWYPHEQKQAPEGYCYCCETKKPCDCNIDNEVITVDE